MRSVHILIAVGAASMISSAAFAADMPSIMPPPPPYYAPPPPQYYAPPPPPVPCCEDFGGWYLRGDIGFSNQAVKRLNNALDATLISQSQRLGFDSGGTFGLGVGYQFNNWFRADFTGEYRGGATFSGIDVNTFSDGGAFTNGADNYRAIKSEWLFLGNAYADLGTWWCITPFVGVGIGGARVTISNFTDQGQTVNVNGTTTSLAYADAASKWNFAYAAYAGLAYKVNKSFTVELAYRYLNLGEGITGDIVAFDGGNAINNPMRFKDITSQDVRLGVRWSLEPTPAPFYAPQLPPLIRKG